MLAVLYSHFFWIFGTFHCAFASYGNYNLNIYLHVYTRNDARNFNYRYCILFVVDSFLYSNLEGKGIFCSFFRKLVRVGVGPLNHFAFMWPIDFRKYYSYFLKLNTARTSPPNPNPRIALSVGWLVGHKISAASYTHGA